MYGSRAMAEVSQLYGIPTFNIVFSAFICSERVGLAVQRHFLTQRNIFVFKDADAGSCEAGAACKLFCSESFLWWDFLELVEVSEHLLGSICYM